MAPAFVFETSSDEEHDDFQLVNEEEEKEEEEVEDEDEDEDKEEQHLNKKTESPWDFTPYHESVVEEHARKSTTSIDFKITKALQNRTIPTIPNYDESESNSNKQEEEDRIEDEDEKAGDAVDIKSLYVPSNKASFNAISFIALNLSRSLLRTCATLEYSKHTPIQSAVTPLTMNGSDLCGSAVTGFGKTVAFAMPTLERLLFRTKCVPAIRVLILTPTRELAVQAGPGGTPVVLGSTPAVPPSYSQPPFMVSIGGVQSGLNNPGPSRPNFDLNSGFMMEGGHRDSGNLRQLFIPGQGRSVEEHTRTNLQPSSSSGVGGKRKEPNSGWESYPFNYKHQQPPWK